MKNKLILFVVCACMWPSALYCAAKTEKQTWDIRQWLRSWWEGPIKAPVAGAAAGYGLSKAVPGFAKIAGEGALYGLGLSWEDFEYYRMYQKAILGMGTVALMGFFAWYFNLLDSVIRSGSLSQDQITVAIMSSVNNLLLNEKLYPTNSSKLHLLNNQDELLGSEFYHYKLFQMTLNEMVSSIEDSRKELKNKLAEDKWNDPYYYGKTQEEWQKYLAKEKEIDEYISSIQKSIVHLSLENKIKTLENIKLGDILGKEIKKEDAYLSYSAQIAAFESVYGRLKLKQEILRNSSAERRVFVEQRYEVTQKAIQALPKQLERKKKMSADEQEKYRKKYLEQQQKALDAKTKSQLQQMTEAEKEIYKYKFEQTKIGRTPYKSPGKMTEEEKKTYQEKGEKLRKKAEEAQKALDEKKKAKEAAQKAAAVQ